MIEKLFLISRCLLGSISEVNTVTLNQAHELVGYFFSNLLLVAISGMSFITPQPDTPPTSAPDSYPLGSLIHAALQSKEYLGQSGTGEENATQTPRRRYIPVGAAKHIRRAFDTRRLLGKPCRHHHRSDAGRPGGGPGRVHGDGHLSGAAHHGSGFSLCRGPERSQEHHGVSADGGRNNHHADHHHHHNHHARARYLPTSCPSVAAVVVVVQVLVCGIRTHLVMLLEGTVTTYEPIILEILLLAQSVLMYLNCYHIAIFYSFAIVLFKCILF